MLKFTIPLLILFAAPQFAQGQQAVIKGTLADSSNNQKPANAVIAVLRQQDSTLVTFTRSDKNGDFTIDKLDSGKYEILITYPAYGDFVDHIDLAPKQTLDLKTIYLTQKAKLLQEIVVKQAAMRLKGDTTEYNADSYEVKPNATVEDLLKQLPGITVDKDGKITAQGQQVQKILVDGDEFFSDDPTVATRNLRADAVSKVQVFDKKSDQAAFTGIDDGNTTKTLNLKLKDNAKNGYFGKLSAAGSDKYYNGQALINAFKAKRKLAAFVIASNTSNTGLGWQDNSNYGFQSNNMQILEGGGIMIFGGGGDDLGSGNFYGEGLPESIKGGIHFGNKWHDDKYNMGGNYLFNQLNLHSAGNTYTQNILADSVYYSRSSQDVHSDRLRHSLAGSSEIQIDSSSSIKVTADGYTGTSKNSTSSTSQALSEQNIPVNSSIRNTTGTGDNSAFTANALWRKKFKKKGRTLSVNFEERYNATNSNGYLHNIADFYDGAGAKFRTDSTDQNKINSNRSNVTGVRATYSEPLSTKSFLEFNYSYYNNSSTQNRQSLNKDASGKYSELVDSLSSDYRYIYKTHSAGVNYLYNAKKINFSIGGNVANTAFEQSDLVKDTTRNYNYYNLAPRASFSYKFNPYRGLRINYNGNTRQPTIDQLQPLTNNEDPLNVIIGNPALKQEFQNSFNMNYNDFKVLSERSIFLGAYYSFTKNDISSTYTIDSLGKRTTQYINVDGNYNASLYGGYYIKIPKTKLRAYFRPQGSYSHNNNFVNGIKNLTKNYNVGTTVGMQYNKPQKSSFDISFNPTYSRSVSSISTVAGTHYWTYDYSFNGSIYPVKKLEIGTDIDFNLRQKINAYDKNNNRIVWNAYVEKKFFKSEELTLRASVNDILNQNKGFDRSIQPNAVVERHYLTFQRYALITLTWNFKNKGGAGAPKSMF